MLRIVLATAAVILSLPAFALENLNDPNYSNMVVHSQKICELGIGDEGAEDILVVYKNTLPEISGATVSHRFYHGSKEERMEQGGRSDCSVRTDRPNEEDVKSFFSLAWEISQRSVVKTLIYHDCKADGELTFKDGSIARWWFSITGVGEVSFPDGRIGSFYCAKCSNLFVLYDLDEKTLKKFGRDTEKDAFLR